VIYLTNKLGEKIRMSINWRKAEGSPKSKQKVTGRELLELREKISKLEEQNFKKDEEILMLKEKLETTESSFKDIINKAELVEKNLKIKISLLQEKLEIAESQIQKQQKRLATVFGTPEEFIGEGEAEEGVIGSYMKGFDNIFGEFKTLRNEVDGLKLTHRNEFKINKYEISQVNDRLDNLISIFEETIPETNKEIERLQKRKVNPGKKLPLQNRKNRFNPSKFRLIRTKYLIMTITPILLAIY